MNPTRTFRLLPAALAGLTFLAATGCEPTKSLQTQENLLESSPTPSHLSATTTPGAFFVSPNGSDYNSGTEAQPWRTLTSALPRLRAGQTLYLRGGTYQENVKNPTIQPGQPSSRITVAAYPGERPVIVGLLHLSRPRYWTLNGINVTWRSGNPSSSHMVKMTNGIGWVIENSEIWGARSYANVLVYGSMTGEPAQWAIRNSCIHDTYASNSTSQDHNIYVNTGTSAGSGLIERNLIFNAPNGVNVKLGYGSSSPSGNDGTANVTVRYNTLAGALKPLMVTEQSHDNMIERNLVVRGTDSYAIRAYKLTGRNNVFRDNGFYRFSKLQYADAGYSSLTQGAGNGMQSDPQFNGTGCDTFKPSNTSAHYIGHLAP